MLIKAYTDQSTLFCIFRNSSFFTIIPLSLFQKCTSDKYSLQRHLEATQQQLEVVEQSKGRITEKLNDELYKAQAKLEAKTEVCKI